MLSFAIAWALEPIRLPEGHVFAGVDVHGVLWAGPDGWGTGSATPLTDEATPIEQVSDVLVDPRGPVVTVGWTRGLAEVRFLGGDERHLLTSGVTYRITRGLGDEVWLWSGAVQTVIQPVSAARGLLAPFDAGCRVRRVLGLTREEEALVVCDDRSVRWVGRGGSRPVEGPGERLVSPLGDRTVVGGEEPAWTDLRSGRVWALPEQVGMSPLAWSMDGRRVVWGSDRAWGVLDLRRRKWTPLEGPPADVVAFSPDGDILWGARGRMVDRFDVRTGALQTPGAFHRDVAWVIAGSREDGVLLTGTRAGERILWRRGAEPMVLPIPEAWRVVQAEVAAGDLSADGRRLVTTSIHGIDPRPGEARSGSVGSAEVIDVATGRSIQVITVDDEAVGPHLAVHVPPEVPKGPFGCGFGEARVLHVPALSDDGRQLMTVGWVGQPRTLARSTILRIWDVDTGALLRTVTFDQSVQRVWFAEGRFHVRAGGSQLGLMATGEPVVEERIEAAPVDEAAQWEGPEDDPSLPAGWTPDW